MLQNDFAAIETMIRHSIVAEEEHVRSFGAVDRRNSGPVYGESFWSNVAGHHAQLSARAMTRVFMMTLERMDSPVMKGTKIIRAGRLKEDDTMPRSVDGVVTSMSPSRAFFKASVMLGDKELVTNLPVSMVHESDRKNLKHGASFSLMIPRHFVEELKVVMHGDYDDTQQQLDNAWMMAAKRMPSLQR